MLAVNLFPYFIKTNKNSTICVFVNKKIKLNIHHACGAALQNNNLRVTLLRQR